jgi:hypothetical protein
MIILIIIIFIIVLKKIMLEDIKVAAQLQAP